MPIISVEIMKTIDEIKMQKKKQQQQQLQKNKQRQKKARGQKL